MDGSEPARVVIVEPAPCTDREQALALLREELRGAAALRAGWSVSLRIERDGPRLSAHGQIADGDGAVRARRDLVQATGGCSALARAVGVWAGLVLESEGPAATPAPAQPPAPAPDPGASLASGQAAWPEPARPEPPSPEQDWYLHHDEGRSLELGAGVFLMSSTGGGAIAGPALFVVVETGRGLFLRPSLAFGESLTSLPPSDVRSAQWLAGRLDACLRLPGLYARRHGMQLDLCGGADAGFTRVVAGATTVLPYIAPGPSLDLRGELGGRLSAVLRLVAGLDVIRPSFQTLGGATEQPPLGGGRLELAFSWDVR